MSKVNYWHMQMHPSNQENEYWEHLEWILEHRQFIGLGQWKAGEKEINKFIKKIKVNDIVVVRKGGSLVALVQVIGGHYHVARDDENNDDRISWIENRRPIRVLAWDTIGRTIPYTRGILIPCRNENKETTQIIKQWHQNVVKVMKKRQVNLTV